MPTKKVAKKSSASATKVTRKTSTTSKKDLVHAPAEKCFWVSDGRVLSNLIELERAFNAMTDDIFSYHVSRKKNDFADWIEHVLNDAELATKMRKAKKPQTAHKVVVTRLKVYSL